MLRPGGVLRLWDVVYSFELADAERRIDAWITETMAADVEHGCRVPVSRPDGDGCVSVLACRRVAAAMTRLAVSRMMSLRTY